MALRLITVNSLSNKKENRTERGLLKYLARMGEEGKDEMCRLF
jgi:hypothetical protein